MRKFLLATVVVAVMTPGLDAQRGRGSRAAARTVTLAITVSDPAGTALPDVVVTLEGPESRTRRTEGGRVAIEGIPAGSYRIRFEREGFVTLERELTARGGEPVEVKVTLKPLPEPAKPVMPAEPPKPEIVAKPMAADLPALIESEFVGKAPSRTSPLACGEGGTATLIQLREPLATHAHPDADEFFYVVGGEGSAAVGTGRQRLKAGMFLFVPRGMTHALAPSGRNPLVVMSTRAGEPCSK